MTAVSPFEVPKANRPERDGVKIIMAVWATIVLTFLFIPILLVIRHSFNRGGSFIVWAHHYSTRWWGLLFNASETWNAVLVFLVIVVASWLIGRFSGVKLLRRWAIPLGVVLAIIVGGLRTNWYNDLFKEAGLGLALRNSFTAAIGGTAIAVVLGGLAGVALARRTGSWSKPFMFVLFLILVTPEIMDGIALLGWFVRVGGPFNNPVGPINNGILRLWVGQSLYTSALVTLIVRARLAGLDESLEEAAADLGAPPVRAFRQITLPIISSALIAGGLLSFTLCLDNTIIANSVSTAGSSTFPVYVIGSAKSTTKPFVGAAAVVLFGITVMALAFVYSVLRRSGDSSSKIASTLAGG
ncbi:MAG: spermidine/putrescine transport system permease protein [Ilumatobacteraceae bacterium]|jgi:ABC-type spermidine/putrescine transport system permease subunit II